MHLIIILILVLALTLGPQYWVQRVMTKYNQKDEDNFPGTGGELARHLLDRYQLDSVKVEVTEIGDHYDPISKTVRLTEDKFNGKTLTAITTAAHEVGHAIQDAAGNSLFHWRTRLATITATAQKLGSFLLFIAPVMTLISRAPSPGIVSALAAFLILGFGIIVQLVTLPVELDASFNKALPLLKDGYLEPEQVPASEKILKAAALTYVAASLAGLLNFWRWLQVLRR